GEGGGELNLLRRVGFDARSVSIQYADQRLPAQERHTEHRAVAADLLSFDIRVFRVLQYVGNVDRATLQRHTTVERAAVGRQWMSAVEFLRLLGKTARCNQVKLVVPTAEHGSQVGAAEAPHRFDQRVEHRLEVGRRAADDLEHVAGGGELVDRARQFGL